MLTSLTLSAGGWAVVSAAAILAVAAFSFCIWRMFANRPPTEADIEWLNDFSVDFYAPMRRLLDESDYEFLAAQPGYAPGIGQKLRAERRRVFRSYLHSLIRDFNALIRLAKFVLIHSGEDRPKLAGEIFRLQVSFYASVAAAELRLALSPLPVGSIDVKALIGSLSLVHDNVGKAAVRAIPAA